MSVEEDLRRVTLQEQRLQFPSFDPARAWDLGVALKEAAESRSQAVAIDVSLHGYPLFFHAMPGTTPNNADWIRRKRNTVFRFFRSSFGMGLTMAQRQTTLSAAYGLAATDYADHGGGFPLFVAGTGCIGAVTVSGLPQRDDHCLVVSTLAAMLQRDISDITL